MSAARLHLVQKSLANSIADIRPTRHSAVMSDEERSDAEQWHDRSMDVVYRFGLALKEFN